MTFNELYIPILKLKEVNSVVKCFGKKVFLRPQNIWMLGSSLILNLVTVFRPAQWLELENIYTHTDIYMHMQV